MLRLVLRLVHRFRPQEGWLPFLLALTAILCAPAAFFVMAPQIDAGGLFVLTVLAAILGLRLARSRFTPAAATVVAGLLGGGLVTLVVGRLLPPFSLFWREIVYTSHWLSRSQQALAGQPWPFASVAAYVWRQLGDLGVRLWWWAQAVANSGVASDPVVFVLLASFVAWIIGCFAAWQIYRRRLALVGLLPSGVAIATITYFAGGLATFYLIVYLLCTLSLVATLHLQVQQARWQQTGIDYPGDLGMELALTAVPALVFVLLLAAFFPVFGPQQVQDAFWKVMDRPWSAVERASERLFGPISHGGHPSGPGGHGAAGTLPRAHLLGGGPELSETIVLYVATSDPAPPPREAEELPQAVAQTPRRYWRSVTYDTYTGWGWINGLLEERTALPGQLIMPEPPPGEDLVQQFERLLPGQNELYAVNSPLQVDRTVQTWWHAPGDLAQVTGAPERYTVVSRAPAPTIAAMRAASPLAPPEIADRYLALPDSIPQRVLDLAHRVAGGQETRFDQARAIETYLRAYPYTLELPDPPSDRDLVDYFLFDLQEGYCDYYASAMVVMARAVGIPARLASGYAQGTYDYDRQRWVVTEMDAHSWVEVYFDGIGWVEFEPTAGLPALDRPGGDELPAPVVPALPPRPRRWWQRVPWVLVGMGLIVLLAVAVVIWVWRPSRQRDLVAAELVRDRQARLLRWGERLGAPLRDGQTASEYGAALGQVLRGRGQGSRWLQVRRASDEAPPQVQTLADTFVRSQYSPRPVPERDAWRVHTLWTRLRRYLAWLWLARR
jgi:transglutaminase-like putative cysteine protease